MIGFRMSFSFVKIALQDKPVGERALLSLHYPRHRRKRVVHGFRSRSGLLDDWSFPPLIIIHIIPPHIARQGRRNRRLIPPKLALSHPLQPNERPATTTAAAAMTASIIKPPERPMPHVIPRSLRVDAVGGEVPASVGRAGGSCEASRGVMVSIGISPFYYKGRVGYFLAWTAAASRRQPIFG